jgi:hypothetical protein
VEQVSGDYQFTGPGCGEERGDAGEIAFIVTVRDGEAVGPEGPGLSQMDVGKDKG